MISAVGGQSEGDGGRICGRKRSSERSIDVGGEWWRGGRRCTAQIPEACRKVKYLFDVRAICILIAISVLSIASLASLYLDMAIIMASRKLNEMVSSPDI